MARNFLKDLKGIGDKVSAFILREFHREFTIWKKELQENKKMYYHLQPVDRWVRRISESIREEKLESSHEKAAQQIVENCIKNGVNPVEFNEGAWFIGSYFKEICFICGIPSEEMDIASLLKIVQKKTNVIEDIKRKIINYTRCLKEKSIFPIRVG